MSHELIELHLRYSALHVIYMLTGYLTKEEKCEMENIKRRLNYLRLMYSVSRN